MHGFQELPFSLKQETPAGRELAFWNETFHPELNLAVPIAGVPFWDTKYEVLVKPKQATTMETINRTRTSSVQAAKLQTWPPLAPESKTDFSNLSKSIATFSNPDPRP